MPLDTSFSRFGEEGDIIEEYYKSGLEINSWWEFRARIKGGTEANKHIKAEVTVRSEIVLQIKDCYRDFGKSNYRVYTGIAAASESLDLLRSLENDIRNITPTGRHYLLFQKGLSDFYHHICTALDGLARLIYSIYDDKPIAEYIDKDLKNRKEMKFGWLLNDKLSKDIRDCGFSLDLKDSQLTSIRNIRHNLVHNWTVPYQITDSRYLWDDNIRQQKYLDWPYESCYPSGYHSAVDASRQDLRYIIDLLERAYPLLTKGVAIWETRNKAQIIPFADIHGIETKRYGPLTNQLDTSRFKQIVASGEG